MRPVEPGVDAGDAGSSHVAAERAARGSYGRLLATLAYGWRDIAAAEDALAEAFASALRTWPRDGVPRNPDAWLTTAARRHLLHAARHRRVELDPTITILLQADEHADADPNAVADQRLRLMFVCAHPAIDVEVRTALMLQVVLGLEARQIAALFLVRPATLAQRLVRAKAKIRSTRIRFEWPHADDLPERVESVLEAVYAAYELGRQNATPSGATGAEGDMAAEAVFLAELCAAHLPGHAEALGMLALILYCEARRAAAHDAGRDFIPIHEQDTARWDAPAIRRAEALLMQAAGLAAPGPFQYEAAIQSAHCQRAANGSVPWPQIRGLYERLLLVAPSLGARVGHAVATAEAGDAATALDLLERIDPERTVTYQPHWVARAHLLGLLGRPAEARHAYEVAIGLTAQSSLRSFLRSRSDALAEALRPAS